LKRWALCTAESGEFYSAYISSRISMLAQVGTKISIKRHNKCDSTHKTAFGHRIYRHRSAILCLFTTVYESLRRIVNYKHFLHNLRAVIREIM
jgi:hypothetical protein